MYTKSSIVTLDSVPILSAKIVSFPLPLQQCQEMIIQEQMWQLLENSLLRIFHMKLNQEFNSTLDWPSLCQGKLIYYNIYQEVNQKTKYWY